MPTAPPAVSSRCPIHAAAAPAAGCLWCAAPRLTPLQQQIAADNRCLCGYVLKRYFAFCRPNSPLSHELRSAALRALCDAALRFAYTHHDAEGRAIGRHPRTGKPVTFSTFACWTIWGVCKKLVRSHNRRPRTVALPDGYDHAAPPPAPSASDLRAFAARLASSLPSRAAELVALRFGLNGAPQTLREIGARFGLTPEGVRARVAEALADMRERGQLELNRLGGL